jgi:hypothetical protein
MVDEAMQRLAPEEQEKVRQVLGKIWGREDIKASRQAVQEATKQLRETIRKAAVNEDATLAPVIEKLLMQRMQPQPMPGQPGPFRPEGRPNAEGGEGPEKGNNRGEGKFRLGELMPQLAERLAPEMREKLREAMKGIRDQAEVKEAFKAVSQAEPDNRREKVRQLIDVTKKALRASHPELADAVEKSQSEAGSKPSEPPTRPEPPKAPGAATPGPEVRPAQ